jgi:hypothetical protein
MRRSAAWYCVGGATLGSAALTGRGPLAVEGGPLELGPLELELVDREIALSFPIDYPWRKLKRTKSESKWGGSSSV